MWQDCVTTRGWVFLHCAVPVCLMLAGKEPLCCIPLDRILAVERLQEDSFKMKNMFQIVQPERALYIQVCELISVACSCAILILTQLCLNKTVWPHFSVQCFPGAWQRFAVAWRSACPDDSSVRMNMIVERWCNETDGEHRNTWRKTCPIATVSVPNFTWPAQVSNLGLHLLRGQWRTALAMGQPLELEVIVHKVQTFVSCFTLHTVVNYII